MLIRKILIRLLGFENYLKFISHVFLKTFLKNLYLKEHYQVRFLASLVKPDSICIDIGANLGYFSIPLSHIVGKKGKVWAVEPVPLFRSVLEKNVKQFGVGNIEIVPFALGDNDEEKVKMGTPNVGGVVRHGRTQVLNEQTDNNNLQSSAFVHEVEMRNPNTLFGNLERIDFIKCDVEGYELHILPHLLPLIKKHSPVLEIEIGSLEHKKQILNWLEPLGYQSFYLAKQKLLPFTLGLTNIEELYFLKTD